MGINPNQINITDNTGSSAIEGSVIVSKNTGEHVWSSNSTKSILIPVGTTLQRDTIPTTGRFRFNSDTSVPEISRNSTWKTFGQLNLAGTSDAPGIGFVLDPNTGFYQPNDNELGVTINGSPRTVWTQTGMSINYPLSVSGTVTNQGIVFSNYPGTSVGLTVNRPSGPTAAFLYDDSNQTWTAKIGTTGARIKSNVVPIDSDDLANKAYVDAAVSSGGIATTTTYGAVKLATVSQARAANSTVVATTDVMQNAVLYWLGLSAPTTVWAANNDGSGSGLDADLLDGQHGTYYATASSVSGKVDRSGDTMTGFLSLSGTPISNLHAAPKQYVDTKLALTGGTLTGTLTLAADPTSALQAATKQYADGKLALTGGTMSGAIVLAADPTSALQAATKQYVDNSSSASSLMTKLLTVDGAGSGLDADLLDGQQGSYYASAASVSGKVSKTGDTMSGDLVINSGNGYISLGTNGDITARRSDGTGVIFLGNTGGRYLYHDNTNYIMPNSNLYVNGGLAWTSVNDGSGSGLDADLLDGLHASSFITASSFGSQYLGGNGYQVLPNGLIFQWGTNGGPATFNFPIAFPNICLVFVAGNHDSQGDRVDNAYGYAISASQYIVGAKASTANYSYTGYAVSWVAIGY